MIESKSGWILAPAYDVLNVAILNPDDSEELALTVQGKKRKLNRTHFIQFDESLGLNEKQIENVFKRMILGKPKANQEIDASFLSNAMKQSYTELIESRYKVVFSE